MAVWSEPIYDRTQADVDYAKSQLRDKINDVDLKGSLNANDLNRIESNTRYLADSLIKLYYFNNITTFTEWNMTTIPFLSHINRIINNINVLWEKYHKPPDAVDLPGTLLNFEQVNNIEKNIHLIKEMLDDMISSFRECGTFNCGEE